MVKWSEIEPVVAGAIHADIVSPFVLYIRKWPKTDTTCQWLTSYSLACCIDVYVAMLV